VTISVGTRLGPYEVLAPIGAGGMGEVWRARDSRLDRTVAIKVLPAEFAQNAQLRVRFEREAKAISSLTHPHICTLYDVGNEAGVEFLVMEYLDGESLADRLNRGPLPLDQVLRYGTEIAEALDRAHRAGIVHRDLKPGNVMITRNGAKLLDFGLAKPIEESPLGALTSLRTERKSLTEEGTILGTIQYMSPEQLEGQEVDHRADLFAFGALLYEMATGRRAFSGKSRASLIASILTTDPQPISTIQPLTPPGLERLVRACLAKDPDERLQTAHDAKLQLQWIAEGATDIAPAATAKRRRRDLVAWCVAGLCAIATLVLGVRLWQQRARELATPPVRLAITAPDGYSFDLTGSAAPPAISPDGQKIVFGATREGKRSLWLRRLDNSVAQALPGTEDGLHPFWSPDSREIGFFSDNKLKRLDLSGAASVVICDAPDARGGSWNASGDIIFAERYTPISRVSASGGKAVEVTKLSAAQRDVTHRWPLFLPDGRHFLFLASPVGSEESANTICVGSLDGNLRKTIVAATSQAMFFDGYLLFVRDRALVAQRFDEKALALTGEPVTLPEQQLAFDTVFSRATVAVSPSGTLVYQQGEQPRESQLVWVDRSGKQVGTIGEPDRYGNFSLSPGARMLFTSYRMMTAQPSNIWSFDLEHGVRARVTFGAGHDGAPLVSPDGSELIYSAVDHGGTELRMKDLRTGAERRLIAPEAGVLLATSWSADGQTVFITRSVAATRSDIWYMTLPGFVLHPYLASPAVEGGARISPDGRWVAYQSGESGRPEIYLAPFPPTGAKWQVSTGSGLSPRWRADGKELIFISNDHHLMAASIALGTTPQIGSASPLFQAHTPITAQWAYDMTADAQRFVVHNRLGEQPPPQPLTIVEHFDHELRAASGRR
jgi:Tol biopolymer transport system component/predicted Ser/Thr protein kinase